MKHGSDMKVGDYVVIGDANLHTNRLHRVLSWSEHITGLVIEIEEWVAHHPPGQPKAGLQLGPVGSWQRWCTVLVDTGVIEQWDMEYLSVVYPAEKP